MPLYHYQYTNKKNNTARRTSSLYHHCIIQVSVLVMTSPIYHVIVSLCCDCRGKSIWPTAKCTSKDPRSCYSVSSGAHRESPATSDLLLKMNWLPSRQTTSIISFQKRKGTSNVQGLCPTQFRYYGTGVEVFLSRGDPSNSERMSRGELVKRNAPHARGNTYAELAYVDGLVASSLAAPGMASPYPYWLHSLVVHPSHSS